MSEKVTLSKEEKEKWEAWRKNTIKTLLKEIDPITSDPEIPYLLEVGITRALDQRYSTAEKKLKAMEADQLPTLKDLIPKGSEKQQLVRELAEKQQVLTEEMLRKLSIEQLRDLNKKF